MSVRKPDDARTDYPVSIYPTGLNENRIDLVYNPRSGETLEEFGKRITESLDAPRKSRTYDKIRQRRIKAHEKIERVAFALPAAANYVHQVGRKIIKYLRELNV